MIKRISAIFATICLTTALFCSGVFVCMLPQTTQVLSSFTSNNPQSPFTHDQLVKAANAVRDYTVNNNNFQNVMSVIQNINSEIDSTYKNLGLDQLTGAPDTYTLTNSAINHLNDCFKVISNGRITIAIVLCFGLIFCVIAAITGGKRYVGLVFYTSGYIVIGALLLFAIWSIVDFNNLFTAFHSVFFSQNTWLFSNNSLLISMYPENFWIGMAVVWLISSIVISGIFTRIGKRLKHV